MHDSIQVQKLPTMQLASVTVFGFQNISTAYDQLEDWVNSTNLFLDSNFKMVTIYHDSVRNVAPNKVKISCSVLLKDSIKLPNPIQHLTISPERTIVSSMKLGLDDFEEAWKSLYIWMNNNGHRPSNQQPFEIYHNNFKEHTEKKCIVDLCIPIQ